MSYLSYKKIIRFIVCVSVAFIISIVFTNLCNAQYFGYSGYNPSMYGGGYMQQPYGMQPMYGGYMQQPYGMQSMYGGGYMQQA